jgi:hypothetical protein
MLMLCSLCARPADCGAEQALLTPTHKHDSHTHELCRERSDRAYLSPIPRLSRGFRKSNIPARTQCLGHR